MDALNYEYFIRRIYQVGRFGMDGANADDYRRLEQSYSRYVSEKKLKEEGKPKQLNKSLTELEKDYKAHLQEIIEYVSAAIRVAILNYSNKLSEDQVNQLEQYKYLLSKQSIENLITAIKGADEILLSIGLYPK